MQKVDVEIVEQVKLQDIIYFVKKYDTLQSISNKFNVGVEQIKQDNNLSSDLVEEGDILWIKTKNKATYIVKPLDTIENIAKKFNVTPEHIKELNSISTIFIGQKLYI